VPRKPPKRGRLWLADGSCVRLRPERPNQVWAYDFVQDRTHDGKVLRMLVVVDEFTRECLAIRVERRLGSDEVLEVLAGLFVSRGVPEHIRSDNGPEFVAGAVREWLGRLGVGALFIEPGSPLQGRHRGPDPCGTGSAAALPMGERALREPEREAPGRAARPGDLLQLARLSRAADRPGPDRGLAPALRHGPPALGPRLPAARPRGRRVAGAGMGAATSERWPRRPCRVSLTLCLHHPNAIHHLGFTTVKSFAGQGFARPRRPRRPT
jgi:hypothetical protein